MCIIWSQKSNVTVSDNRAPVGKWYTCSICICNYFFAPHVLLIWYEKNKDSFKQVVQLYPTGWQFETLSGSNYFFLYMHVCKHKSKIFVIYSTNYYIPIVNPRRLNTQALDVNILWVQALLWALRTNLHQWTVEFGRSW